MLVSGRWRAMERIGEIVSRLISRIGRCISWRRGNEGKGGVEGDS